MLPATLDLVAFSGNVAVNAGANANVLVLRDVGNANLVPIPSASGSDTGTITIVAAQSVNLGAGLSMPDLNTTTTQFVGKGSNLLAYTNYISPLGVPQANLPMPLHANDPAPVVIAAGRDINASGATVALLKPAEIEAGNNINALTLINGLPPASGQLRFTGENNNATDITSIVAGNDLIGGNYKLFGPGILLFQAGHNMGPFLPSSTVGSSPPTFGIATAGNGFGASHGAEIDLLFGVKPGIDYAAAIAQYVNPANAGAGGIDFRPSIAQGLAQLFAQEFQVQFQALASAAKFNTLPPAGLQAGLDQFNRQLTAIGLSPVTAAQLHDPSFTPNYVLSTDKVWAYFQTLPVVRQDLLVQRGFLDFLTQVALDLTIHRARTSASMPAPIGRSRPCSRLRSATPIIRAAAAPAAPRSPSQPASSTSPRPSWRPSRAATSISWVRAAASSSATARPTRSLRTRRASSPWPAALSALTPMARSCSTRAAS
jgi:hypothetical protein